MSGSAEEPRTASSSQPALAELDVLFLASLTGATGNTITAQRIAAALGARRTELLDVATFADGAALRSFVAERRFGAVVGVHAYRAGRLMRGCGAPYVVILGGTDMNVMLAQPERREAMCAALAEAGAVVAFNRELLEALLEALPAARPKAFVVPQAVASPLLAAPRPPAEAAADAEAVRGALGVCADSAVLLLPAGLRPVKDVLFLCGAVAAWAAREPRVCLRIVGPELEREYADAVKRGIGAAAPSGAVAYVGPMGQAELHVAMRLSLCVLNSSRSEGMCNSVLEAQLLGTPVLARRNAGNASLVESGRTGFLFETADECVAQAERLLREPGLAEGLADAARAQVAREHGAAAEAAAYTRVLACALAGGG